MRTWRRRTIRSTGCFWGLEGRTSRVRLPALEQVFAPDRDEYGENHRADEQAHQAEGRHAADDTEHHQQERNTGLPADDEGAHDVVDPTDDNRAPDQKPDAGR